MENKPIYEFQGEELYDSGINTSCFDALDKVINAIPQQPQVQYDLSKQLRKLRHAANKLGLYDAADFIK